MNRIHRESPALDDINAALIEALRGNSRISMRDLAQRVGMSAPAVTERVRRLEDIGVIRGYTIDVDQSALGYPIKAVIRIKPHPGQLQRVEGLIRAMPECTQCEKITGEDCYIARVCVTAIDRIDPLIETLSPFAETNTAIVKAVTVAERLPPLRYSSET